MADRLLKIGELARATGLRPRTVRFYESVGLLPKARRNQAGYRIYSGDDVKRLQFIEKAKAVGFTLAEIRSIATLKDAGTAPCTHVQALIDRKLHEIRVQQQALEHLAGELVRLQQAAQAQGPCPDCVCGIIEHDPVGDKTWSAPEGAEEARRTVPRMTPGPKPAGD
jgi:DNA-binding transcriptional MerR regulator